MHASIFRPVMLTAALLTLGAPAFAQATTFYPSVRLKEAYTDNVSYVDAGASPLSDWMTRIELDLPLRREFAQGWIGLTYAPSYEKHQDLTALDRPEHHLAFHASTSGSRGTAFGAGAYFHRTQEQGRADSFASPDLFLSNRTNRDLYGVDLTLTRQVSKRWRWSAAAGGSRSSYSAIPDFETGSPSAVVEDRSEYRGKVGVESLLTRATSLGAEYEHRRFDLETGSDEDADLLGVTLRHEVGRDFSWNLRLGGYQRSGGDPETGATESGAAGDGIQGGFSLKRSYRSGSLTLNADVTPSSGGSLQGTSTDTSAGLILVASSGSSFTWNAAARYAYRDPTDPALSSLSSAGGGFSLEWRPVTRLGLRLGVNYLTQAGNDDPALDTSFTTGSVGLVWYPRGYPREAGTGGGSR